MRYPQSLWAACSSASSPTQLLSYVGFTQPEQCDFSEEAPSLHTIACKLPHHTLPHAPCPLCLPSAQQHSPALLFVGVEDGCHYSCPCPSLINHFCESFQLLMDLCALLELVPSIAKPGFEQNFGTGDAFVYLPHLFWLFFPQYLLGRTSLILSLLLILVETANSLENQSLKIAEYQNSG